MSVASNSLPTMLAVYAQANIEQFVADIPILSNMWLDLSDEIKAAGQTVTTRVPTTVYSTPGDLANGWPDTAFSASNITVTLKGGVYSHKFDEVAWSTITPTLLQNVTFPSLTKQLANGMIVDALNNVTSSVFTKTITVNSASNVTYATLQTASNFLTTNETPRENRMSIVTPNAYQSLLASVPFAYQYGNTDALQQYGYNSLLPIAGFQRVIDYPRLVNTTPVPGGAKYTNNDKVLALCMAKTGLVFASRQPVDVNYGSTWTGTATFGGLSLQYRIVYDQSLPAWRVASVSIYGSAAGNPNAIVPVLSLSTT